MGRPLVAGHVGTFTHAGPDRYVMTVASCQTTFDLDRVRRERHECWGELIVRCDLKGAHTLEGILSAADFNISGQQSRSTRAKYLAERSKAADIDWMGLVEEFCQRVIAFDRSGTDAPVLRSLAVPPAAVAWTIDGLGLLQRHPVILFGDGGQGKSLVALYLAGVLAQRGISILYCDWEFDGESHRARYGGLFGEGMPDSIRYAKCDRPLVAESDRLRRLVQQYHIDYLVCDSIVFACAAGVPAESAEAASSYFQALRQIGVGSLNLAHTTKAAQSEKDDRQQHKPFGSVFWANGARATWFLKGVSDRSRLAIGLYPRKANTGPLGPSVGWSVDFLGERIRFSALDVAAHRDLGQNLKVWERIASAVDGGAQTIASLSDDLGVDANTIVQAVRRKNGLFARFSGTDGIQRIGLISQQSDTATF